MKRGNVICIPNYASNNPILYDGNIIMPHFKAIKTTIMKAILQPLKELIYSG
jgi:hypothetical protein